MTSVVKVKSLKMLIDVNVSFGNWPFQKFLLDTPGKLAKHLKGEGISHALVSSTESVFYPDPDVYNKILFRKLRPYLFLIPIPIINPSLSNWKENFKRYKKIKAVKILPNYHNYSLSAKSVNELMNELAKRKIPLMIQMRLEDERNQYPLLKVPGVNYKEIIKLANRFPRAPILCLCPYFPEAVSLVKETANVYVDIAFVERLNTVATLLKEIPASRILFGSHTPFLYTRSAMMKIKTADISRKDAQAIMFANISHLLRL